MKKITVMTLAMLSALTLTGCDKSLKKEQFAAVLDDVTATINAGEQIKNVHINNRLSVNSYNYKEGEFYSYRSFFTVILITTDVYDCVWGQDGKYYHATRNKINGAGTETYKEITKDEFDSLMVEKKAKIAGELLAPVIFARQLMNEENKEESSEKYKTFKNSYKYSRMESTYTMTSKLTYDTPTKDNPEVMEEATKNVTFNFKNNLPTSYKTKDKSASNNSTQEWKYTYGKAEFYNPKAN